MNCPYQHEGGGKKKKGKLLSNFTPFTPHISASKWQGFLHSSLSTGEFRPQTGSVLRNTFMWLNAWKEEHIGLCTSPIAPWLSRTLVKGNLQTYVGFTQVPVNAMV